MNTQPKKSPKIIDEQLQEALKATPGRFWNRLSHNWGWKVLSLFLAICLWAGLIMQDPNLTRERRFTSVPISLVGEDTMRRNGLIVLSGLEDDKLQLESFRAQIPQRSYNSVTAANYNPRIDLTRITETGEQDVKVLFTSSSTYGTVESSSPDTFPIVVDDYVTSYRVPVSLNPLGQYPAGFYAASPIMEPSTVAVSGPKSLVDQVASVQADFDRSSLTPKAGTTRLALPLRFYDAQGNQIDSRLLEASNANTVLRTITVEQRLYASKTIDVSQTALIEGTPASGYEVKSVSTVPSTLIAAGDPAVLENIELLLVDTPVSVKGMSESFTADVRISKPAELNYLSSNTVSVQVEIGPVITTTEFTEKRINIENVPTGLSASANERYATVQVTGPQLTIRNLRSSHFRLVVNASELTPGVHKLPVEVVMENGSTEPLSFAIFPANIELTLE